MNETRNNNISRHTLKNYNYIDMKEEKKIDVRGTKNETDASRGKRLDK